MHFSSIHYILYTEYLVGFSQSAKTSFKRFQIHFSFFPLLSLVIWQLLLHDSCPTKAGMSISLWSIYLPRYHILKVKGFEKLPARQTN